MDLPIDDKSGLSGQLKHRACVGYRSGLVILQVVSVSVHSVALAFLSSQLSFTSLISHNELLE